MTRQRRTAVQPMTQTTLFFLVSLHFILIDWNWHSFWIPNRQPSCECVLKHLKRNLWKCEREPTRFDCSDWPNYFPRDFAHRNRQTRLSRPSSDCNQRAREPSKTVVVGRSSIAALFAQLSCHFYIDYYANYAWNATSCYVNTHWELLSWCHAQESQRQNGNNLKL